MPDRENQASLKDVLDDWRPLRPDGKRKVSWDDIAHDARRYGAPAGFNGAWLSKVLSGGRPHDTVLLAALARALGREPDQLPHYRLSAVRDRLDEQKVGIAEALTNLDASGIDYGALGLSELGADPGEPGAGSTPRPVQTEADQNSRRSAEE